MSVPVIHGRSAKARPAGRVARLRPGPALAVLFGIVYACFLTRNYYWDGLSFAIEIEHAQTWRDLFNVHHLLYNFIGYGEYLLLGRSVRVLYLMQWTNCVAGAILIWLVYRLLRSFEVPVVNSAAGAALLATAATFWKFTTDADSYILANVFLVAAFLTIPRAPLRGALLHVGALMMHQLSALFYPVALLLLWRSRKERFRLNALLYTTISAGLTLAAYGAAYRFASHRAAVASFPAWLTYHAQVPFSFHPISGAVWVILGTARLFAGGKPEPIALAAAPLSLGLAGWAIRRITGSRRQFLSVKTARPLLVWVGVYVGFLLIWEPYNTFYRLFYLTPLVALLAIATRALPARPLAALAAALLCWNFLVYIYPNSRVERNSLLVFALAQQKQWPPGTGIIFSQLVPDLWTISYFNPQVSWIPLENPDPARVTEIAAFFAKNGGTLYLDWTYLTRSGRPAARFYFERVPR
jgi:hypothetical protein